MRWPIYELTLSWTICHRGATPSTHYPLDTLMQPNERKKMQVARFVWFVFQAVVVVGVQARREVPLAVVSVCLSSGRRAVH